MHGNRFGHGVALEAPYLVHKLQSRENFVRVRQQFVQQQKFLLRKLYLLARATYGKRIVVQNGVSHHYFAFAFYLCAAKKRLYVQQKFLVVERLAHEVVDAGNKALFSVLGQLFCRNHQNGQFFVKRPQLLGKFVAVDPRHHNVNYNEIDVFAVERFKRRIAAVRLGNRVMLA